MLSASGIAGVLAVRRLGTRRMDAIRRGAYRCWSVTLGLVVVEDLLEDIPAQGSTLRRARGWAAKPRVGQ